MSGTVGHRVPLIEFKCALKSTTGGEPVPHRRGASLRCPARNVARPLDDGVLEIRHRPLRGRAVACFLAQRPSAHHREPSDSLAAAADATELLKMPSGRKSLSVNKRRRGIISLRRSLTFLAVLPWSRLQRRRFKRLSPSCWDLCRRMQVPQT